MLPESVSSGSVSGKSAGLEIFFPGGVLSMKGWCPFGQESSGRYPSKADRKDETALSSGAGSIRNGIQSTIWRRCVLSVTL